MVVYLKRHPLLFAEYTTLKHAIFAQMLSADRSIESRYALSTRISLSKRNLTRERGRMFFSRSVRSLSWVHVSQAGERSENEVLTFCLPYGLWLPSFSWLP